MNVKARVFHNVTAEGDRPVGMLDGYKIGHEVALVAELTIDLDTDDPTWALEKAFFLCNVGDDPDFGTPDPQALAYRARGNRSLSMGDVVEVNGQFYGCAWAGWTEVPEPTIVTRAAYATTPLLTEEAQ